MQKLGSVLSFMTFLILSSSGSLQADEPAQCEGGVICKIDKKCCVSTDSHCVNGKCVRCQHGGCPAGNAEKGKNED